MVGANFGYGSMKPGKLQLDNIDRMAFKAVKRRYSSRGRRRMTHCFLDVIINYALTQGLLIIFIDRGAANA